MSEIPGSPQSKAGKVTADVMSKYNEQIVSMKSGIEQALTAMGESIDSARSRFKQPGFDI